MKKRNLEDKLLVLLRVEHLLTAPEIVTKLTSLDQNYNKTSVYRALDRLLENETICQHHVSQKGVCYELRDQHHDHLQCEHCGLVEKISCTHEHPTSIEGFKVTHHHLTYLGLCQDCQQLSPDRIH